MSKLFLSTTFIATCLISNITQAGGNSLGAAASAKHQQQVEAVPSFRNQDASPQSNTNGDMNGRENTNSLGAAASAKHQKQVEAVPSFRNQDASPQSSTNADMDGRTNTNSLGRSAIEKHNETVNSNMPEQ
jgi:hypothetical protein